MADRKDQIVDEDEMKKMSVAPPDPADKAKDGEKAKDAEMTEDEELEEGLEETFPASDPPANVQPGHTQPVPSSGAPDETDEDED